MKNGSRIAMMLSLMFCFASLSFVPLPSSQAGQDHTSRALLPSATFNPPQPVGANAIGTSVALHRAPSLQSPVVATIKGIDQYANGESLPVSSISGSFLRIRHNGIEGYASMRQALPHTLAFIFDADTGATIARLPVEAGENTVIFSPDGSRALIYGRNPYSPAVAYEYNTKDYTPTRTITATGVSGKPVEVRAVFFGGRDQSLYAMVQDDTNNNTSDFAIVRVHKLNTPAAPPVLRSSGIDFVASPDGHFGFVLRSEKRDPSDLHFQEAIIDVFDLREVKLRNTLTLTGELAAAFSQIVTNFDGSELYLLGDVSRLRVLDTASGKEVRQVPTGFQPDPQLFLKNLCSGGRSLLLQADGNHCEVAVPEGASWITNGARTAALLPIYAVDTGKARYGVDDGRHLFLLGANDKIVRTTAIRQPNLTSLKQMIWAMSLTASPNGAQLILMVSYGEEFCPC